MRVTRRAFIAGLASIAGIVAFAPKCVASRGRLVSEQEALSALEVARSRIGDQYQWGGQDVGGFDCSGLILWAYGQAIGRLQLKRPDGQPVSDATMHEIYSLHCANIPHTEARPGDIVAIAQDGSGVATHGGLVEQVSGGEVWFVNASSYHGKVVSDVWPLSGSKRGQHVIGFGRLLVAERLLFGFIRI